MVPFGLVLSKEISPEKPTISFIKQAKSIMDRSSLLPRLRVGGKPAFLSWANRELNRFSSRKQF
jgi:hypothetical protein